MNGLNGIILNGQVYIVESAETPCIDCDLKQECRHGMLIGRICSVIDHGERLRFSQTLTYKINGNGIQQEDTSAGL